MSHIPRKHKKWVTPDVIERLREAASNGASRAEQAQACGYSPPTFYARLRESAEMRAAIEEGEAIAISRVENALFRNATEPARDPKTGAPVGPPAGSVDAEKFFLARRGGPKWRETTDDGDGVARQNVRVTIVLPDNARAPKVIDAPVKRIPS